MINVEYEPRGLIHSITLIIFQDSLKSANLLHKMGFIDSQTVGNVSNINDIFHAQCIINYKYLYTGDSMAINNNL